MRLLLTFTLFLSISSNSNAQETIALVEQFTGFRGAYCPQGIDVVDSLKTEFQDSAIFVNIHSGIFAEPLLTGPVYQTDLTTPSGETYNQFFQMNMIPAAMISRRPNLINPQTNSHNKDEWRDKVSDIVSLPKPIDMTISYTYDATNNEFDIDVQNEIMVNLSGNHNIVYYLVEDNVIANQKLPDFTIDSTYTHNDVLRDVLNTTWGELLFSGATTAGTIIPHTIQYTPTSNAWNLNNCSIIAYVRNTNNEEVIQVAKINLAGVVRVKDVNLIQLKLYPNPASDAIQYTFESSHNINEIGIIDAAGRSVSTYFTDGSTSGELNISNLELGTYFLQFKSDKQIILTKKISKL